MSLTDGLIGAWCPSLGPSGYTLLDRSGRGNHGTLTNMDAATDWVGGPGGWVIDGDGSNDRVHTALRLPTSGMTYCGWVLIRSFKSGFINRPFGEADNAVGTAGSSIILNAGGPYVAMRGGSARDINASSAAATSTNQWYHWAVTLSDAPRVWRNGILIATGTGSTIASWNKGFKILADDDAGGSTTINGQVSDVGVWNRALTQNEISQLWQLRQGGLGRLLTQRAQRRAYRTQAAVKSYLFLNRGQVIGGGTL
jgi:hypothetical protein